MMQERQGHLGMGSHQKGCPDMKPTPFLLLLSRLNRRPLSEQIIMLRALVHAQSLRSVQRAQLETLLRGKLTKQLRRESKEQVA